MGTFEEFWQLYPSGRKTNKKGCKEKWAAKKLDNKAAEILEDVRWRAKYHEPWLKDDGKFVPMPSTYLSQERWGDDRVDIRDKQKAVARTAQKPPELPNVSRVKTVANKVAMRVMLENRGPDRDTLRCLYRLTTSMLAGVADPTKEFVASLYRELTDTAANSDSTKRTEEIAEARRQRFGSYEGFRE